MSAADGLRALETRAASMRLTRWALVVVGALVLLTAAYCAGTHRGAVDQQLHALAARRDTIRDTIRVLDTALVHDTVRVRVTQTVALATRDTASHALHDARLALQQAISRPDSTGADSVARVLAQAVLPDVEACGRALVADSLSYAALHVAFVDMAASRDQWQRADQVDSARVVLLEKERAPRIGWKGGAVIGAGLMALLVHLVR